MSKGAGTNCFPSSFIRIERGRKADFYGIDGLSCLNGDYPALSIRDLLREAHVKVDTLGTKVAAASPVMVGISRSVDVTEGSIIATADRPIIFLTRELGSGAIPFVGRLLPPIA